MGVETIFQSGVKQGASDIHLAHGLKPYFRIGGELFESTQQEVVNQNVIKEFVTRIFSTQQKERFVKNGGIDFGYLTSDGSRFRVNVHREKGVLGLAARVIPSRIPTMEETLMPETLYDLTRLGSGLVIVTGPSGCGKSTTLAAMINQINNERKSNILTLEDPIEFLHPHAQSIIKQRELGVDMFSFAEALKQGLRQDPNVIMVGEMRDPETISTTITVAETGHLVLATLHTHNAAQTIDRIIDSFPPHQQDQVRIQLSLSLRAVVAQRLVPRADGGRVAIREILVNNPAVSNLIRENKIEQIQNVIQTNSGLGMIGFDQAFKQAVASGLVSKEIAAQNMDDPQLLGQ